jgi:hypothetical protein
MVGIDKKIAKCLYHIVLIFVLKTSSKLKVVAEF